MIEHFFRAGVRFLWLKPRDGAYRGDGAIVPSVGGASFLTYDGLHGIRAAVDPMLIAIHASSILGIAKGSNIQYDWLDYAPGGVAQRAIAGRDILTGFMSGCLIARGTHAGRLSAFHVGTIDNNAEANRRVKRNFAENLPLDATGFEPAAAWSAAEIGLLQNRITTDGQATARIFGLVTSAGGFYSVLLFNVTENNSWQNRAGQNYWCVGGIKQSPALNRVKLMAKLMS